jgi:glutamyl endopeptidase
MLHPNGPALFGEKPGPGLIRRETVLMPDGPHTAVTNIALESAPVQEQNVEEPFGGDPPDSQATTDDGREKVPRPPKLEALSTEVWRLPDTSSLLDIGVASFGEPKTIAETVHGPDDRIQITQTTKYAWRANASLLITARDGSQWIGTGWFIGPRTLATAGHCVCIKGSGIPGREGWVKNIQVIPARNQQSAPLGAATSTVFWSVKGWVDAGDENYDYAAVIIPTPLGKQTGWFGFAVLDDTTLAAAMANIAGYPGDKPSGTLWWDAHQIAAVNPTKVFYDIDSFGGQSGAAVYVIRDQKRIGVAIHAYGGPVTNSGTRISPPVFQNLKSWKML